MSKLQHTFARLYLRTLSTRELAREDGQTIVEYGLILALIAIALVAAAAFSGLDTKIEALFTSIGTDL